MPYKRQRGGMVTQRIANPFTPVRFRALPPNKLLCYIKKKVSWPKLHSSVAQLVEQLTVNHLVAGSSPARGARLSCLSYFVDYSIQTFSKFNLLITRKF